MLEVILSNFLLQAFFSIGLVIIAGILIGLINRGVYHFLGESGRSIAIVTGIVGTPIHELGHAIMCIIFGHKITDISLFSPDSTTGVLGYVNHSYNKKNLYHQIGNFFIGIGPIISCGIAMSLIMYLAVPSIYYSVISAINNNTYTLSGAVDAINQSLNLILFNSSNLKDFNWWIFIILNFSIALHMAISVPDIRCSAKGLLFILGALLALDIVVGIISIHTLNAITDIILSLSYFLIALLALSLLMSLIMLCIAFIFKKGKKLIIKY